MGSGANNLIRVLKNVSGNLFIGGDFTTLGGATTNKFGRWTPATNSYTVLHPGITNGNVHCMDVVSGNA
jgi:hypothetical protein